MQTCKKFQINITYLNEQYRADVTELSYPNHCILYKIKLRQAKFWFIKCAEEWKYIGDFQLAPKLKGLLIRKIEKVKEADKCTIDTNTAPGIWAAITN